MGTFEAMFANKNTQDIKTIDFNEDKDQVPSAPTGGQEDYIHVMKQSESTTIDIQRIRSNTDILKEKKAQI